MITCKKCLYGTIKNKYLPDENASVDEIFCAKKGISINVPPPNPNGIYFTAGCYEGEPRTCDNCIHLCYVNEKGESIAQKVNGDNTACKEWEALHAK